MPKLLLPTDEKLLKLVKAYNVLDDKPADMNTDIDRLFYLQKINYFIQGLPPNPQFISWRNQLGDSGLESNLQRYGIHRDSSPLLQSIEFANAVRHFPTDVESSEQSLYKAMSERDKLFKDESTAEQARKSYVQMNRAIMKQYDNDPKLQEKIIRSKHFLGLSYAKVDAIQGLVQQDFNEYQTEVLGSSEGHNKNFTFNIDGETNQVVIRVEDRNTLGREQVLQSHEVSHYFSEDYATIMVPFKEGATTAYKPVVVSEFAKEGDLLGHATILSSKNPIEKIEKVQHFFGKLNDFCLKLMESGHYHPDIKLSNFLTDGDRIFLSDRKTITNNIKPKVNDILSSPLYGAPEFRKCLNRDEEGEVIGYNVEARRTSLDMPSYMSFQMGMALKEFMLNSKAIPCDEKELNKKLQAESPIIQGMSNPSNELKNISVLIQELTRPAPIDRLKIKDFQSLLSQIQLPPEQFMAELEKLSPKEQLTTNGALQKFTEALRAWNGTILNTLEIETMCQDPRIDISPLLNVQQLDIVKIYLPHWDTFFLQLDDLLLVEDKKRASIGSLFIHYITGGYRRVPRVSSVSDLVDDIPKMDKQAQAYMRIIAAAGPEQFKEINAAQREIFQKYTQHFEELHPVSYSSSLMMGKMSDSAPTEAVKSDEIPGLTGDINKVPSIQPDRGSDEPELENEESPGTFVPKDEESPGTFVPTDGDKPESDTNAEGIQQEKEPKLDFVERAKKHQDTSQLVADDIITTIQRGNKKADTFFSPAPPADPSKEDSKAKSNDIKGEGGQDSTQEDQSKKPS